MARIRISVVAFHASQRNAAETIVPMFSPEYAR
jgi:hypothetical protein